MVLYTCVISVGPASVSKYVINTHAVLILSFPFAYFPLRICVLLYSIPSCTHTHARTQYFWRRINNGSRKVFGKLACSTSHVYVIILNVRLRSLEFFASQPEKQRRIIMAVTDTFAHTHTLTAPVHTQRDTENLNIVYFRQIYFIYFFFILSTLLNVMGAHTVLDV